MQPPAMSASQTCHGTRYYYYGATKIFKTNFILPFKVTGRLDVFPAVERGLLAVIFEGLHQSLHTWSWTLWPSFRFRLSRCSRRCRFNDCVTACWRQIGLKKIGPEVDAVFQEPSLHEFLYS